MQRERRRALPNLRHPREGVRVRRLRRVRGERRAPEEVALHRRPVREEIGKEGQGAPVRRRTEVPPGFRPQQPARRETGGHRQEDTDAAVLLGAHQAVPAAAPRVPRGGGVPGAEFRGGHDHLGFVQRRHGGVRDTGVDHRRRFGREDFERRRLQGVREHNQRSGEECRGGVEEVRRRAEM